MVYRCSLTGNTAGVPWHRAGEVILLRCSDDYPGSRAVQEADNLHSITACFAVCQHTLVTVNSDVSIGKGRKITAVKHLNSHLHL